MVESLRRRASRFGLDVLLVNVWEGQDAAEETAAYCQRWGIEATVLLDESAEFAKRMGIRGVPTNVFVDAAGVVRAVGATTSEDLLREASRLEPQLLSGGTAVVDADRTPSGFATEQR